MVCAERSLAAPGGERVSIAPEIKCVTAIGDDSVFELLYPISGRTKAGATRTNVRLYSKSNFTLLMRASEIRTDRAIEIDTRRGQTRAARQCEC